MKKNILAIVGSAGENSSNEQLVGILAELSRDYFNISIFKDLKKLPHFDPFLSTENPPGEIIEVRNLIEKADGIIICTPEYVFSIPAGLKNLIEWCVATTVFSNKPAGLITASADGQKGHEELKLIMTTLMAGFNDHTTLLIRGIKSKFNEHGRLTDEKTQHDLMAFLKELNKLSTPK